MDEYSSSQYEGLGAAVKRKRSQTLRRPRPETQWFPVSSDDANGEANSKEKIFNLSQCIARGPSVCRVESPSRRTKDEDGGFGMVYGNGDVRDDNELGQGAPSRQFRSVTDGTGNENKLKKVKLKVGGVTRTIQTKSSVNGVSGGMSSTKSARYSDTSRCRLKSVHQGNFDGDDCHSPDKKGSAQSWKELSKFGGNHGKEGLVGKMPAIGAPEKQGDNSDPVRKSKRMPKKRVLDEAFDDDDDDDEIRYLEKLKFSKASGFKESQEELNKNKRSASRSVKHENVEGLGRSGKDWQKYKSDRVSEDTEYEEEELLSEGETEGKEKNQKRDTSDSAAEVKREMNLTTRQRALLSSKDTSGGSQIEFPNGLPPPPPRKQKEKLSEVEQQLKRAEAAERRRLQNQKANEEEQAEAIRKILGQDAGRKKREEQRKKRMDEWAQGKAANQAPGANTIRWVMGPTGTVVTFPQEMGLPRFFDSNPCNYPPPREKCAGPSCTNPYKYRDSKYQLPLCSLQCYKAIHEKKQTETT